MKILSIDTSTKYFVLSICDESKMYELNLEVEKRLSSLINITIQRALNYVGIRLDDLDYFACGLGPGSFTGLRIGVAAIKGFCLSLKKPVIGISSLDILAKNASHLEEKNIIPIIDAKRGLIYSSVYKIKDNRLLRLKQYTLETFDELLKNKIKNPVFLGDAVDLYKHKIISSIRGAVVLDKDYWFPKGHHIAELALKKIRSKKISNPFTIKPIYLYPKECQIRK
ncbi:MAG: tRNA (adenosine(37)-N6)-threonylcarbamoyltransferase complex dimerization subunit type 1 TsaB [Candidatus Omnitrophica bacterium]|nr:tRNA (adenosine(37)-N6)-threonylcarbamoyltransferase complex dimerization subunit type 1 TsaB [Candidatus Omnitrophota bacterium]